MNIRELITVFGFKTDETAVRRYEGAVAGVKTQMAATANFARSVLRPILGGLTLGSPFLLAKQVADLGDEIATVAGRLGVGTQALQEWRHAARMSDVETGEFDAGVQMFTRNIGLASSGNKEAAKNFSRYGISLKDAAGKMRDPLDVLEDVAAVMARTEDAGKRAAIAQRLVGKGGAGMINLLRQGKPTIQALRKELHDLGGVLTDEDIAAASAFDDTWKRFLVTAGSVKNRIGLELLPTVTDLVGRMRQWISTNREWLGTKIDRGVDLITDSLGGLIAVAKGAREALRGMGASDAMTDIATLSAFLGVVFGPGGLAAGFLLVFLQDLQKWRTDQKSVLGEVLGDYQSWIRDAKEAWTDWSTFVTEKMTGPMQEFWARVADRSRGEAQWIAKRGTRGGRTWVRPSEQGILSGLSGLSMPSSDALVSQAHGAVFGSPNRSTTVNSNITVNVPPGTPDEHKRIIDEAAAAASRRMREEWTGMLRQGIADTAVVE